MSDQHQPDFSVVIPTYNEEVRAKEMQAHLQSIGTYFTRVNRTYEIVIALDGPTDGTPELVAQHERDMPHIRVLHRDINHGKGFTVREGLIAAQGKIRLFTDMDGATPIAMLDRMIPYFDDGADIVIGSRDHDDADIKKHQPLWKELLGDGGNLAIQFIGGLWGMRDTQCGFKAFTQKAVQDIMPRTTVEKWGIDFEILMIGKKRGFRIVEVPVEWNDAGESLVGISGYISTFRDLLTARWNMIRGVYRLKEDV